MRSLHPSVVVLVVLLVGCFTVPSAPEPSTSVDANATYEPGYGSNDHMLARWTCPVAPAKNGEGLPAPRVEIVLVKDPERGVLLHNLTDDFVMPPAETIPGGGTRYPSVTLVEKNDYVVPSDHADPVTRKWSLLFGTTRFESTQQCTAGPLPRFL